MFSDGGLAYVFLSRISFSFFLNRLLLAHPPEPTHLPAFGSHPMGWRQPSFGAAQQFCLTRVGQESSFCRAARIKVREGEAARRQEVGGPVRERCGPAPPICLSLHWSVGATVCPGFDEEGVTHAAGGAADEDAAWQDKEKEATDSGESRVSEAENQSGGVSEQRREHMASERLHSPPL